MSMFEVDTISPVSNYSRFNLDFFDGMLSSYNLLGKIFTKKSFSGLDVDDKSSLENDWLVVGSDIGFVINGFNG